MTIDGSNTIRYNASMTQAVYPHSGDVNESLEMLQNEELPLVSTALAIANPELDKINLHAGDVAIVVANQGYRLYVVFDGAKFTAPDRVGVPRLVAPYTGFNGARGIAQFLYSYQNQIGQIIGAKGLYDLFDAVNEHLLDLRFGNKLPDALGSMAVYFRNLYNNQNLLMSIGDVGAHALAPVGQVMRLSYPDHPKAVPDYYVDRYSESDAFTPKPGLFAHSNQTASSYLIGSRGKYGHGYIQESMLGPSDSVVIMTDGAWSQFQSPNVGMSLNQYVQQSASFGPNKLDTWWVRDDTTVLVANPNQTIQNGIYIWHASFNDGLSPVSAEEFLRQTSYQTQPLLERVRNFFHRSK